MTAARIRPAASALVLLAAAIAAMASSSSAQTPGNGVSVKIASTGNDSELRRTVPIARHPGGGSRVAMSMAPSDVPSLEPGDVLEVSAEVQVTTDCLNRQPPRECRGGSYRYNPLVGAQLVLAGNSEAVTGPGTLALAGRRRITCRQKPPDREHHCMVVFTAAELPLADPSSLPCAPQCHVNLVIDAHNPAARANDRLIIGSTGAHGGVVQDKGRINLIRTRGADPAAHPLPQPAGTVTSATDSRLIGGLTLDKPPRKAVVYSQPVEGLEAREQLFARGIMKTGVVRLRHNANVSGQIILADSPTAIHPSQMIRNISLLGGEITENNGINCTQRTTPCTTDKIGVIGIIEDAPATVYVNLVMGVGRVGGRAPGDNLVRVTAGGLELTRYPPED